MRLLEMKKQPRYPEAASCFLMNNIYKFNSRKDGILPQEK